MVFGSSLLLMAFLLSGGQPILSDVEKTVAVGSETGSPVPCPKAEGEGDCKCKGKCDWSITLWDGTVCDYKDCVARPFEGRKYLICRYKNPKKTPTPQNPDADLEERTGSTC